MNRQELHIAATPMPAAYAEDLSGLCLQPDQPLREVIDRLDQTGKGIVLVVDSTNKLIGTLTDGDIRRWMLGGHSLDASITEVLAQKKSGRYQTPVTAPYGTARDALLRLMQENVVHQVPIVEEDGTVVNLVTMNELLPEETLLPMQAVIMAGGFGTRLRPLTDGIPKPMLPVGDRPLMETIIRQMQSAGIRRVNVATHYMAEKIVEHFGNGERFGMEFKYVSEDRPLGTAGALSLIDKPKDRLLVMNGDILTSVDFRSLLDYHQEHGAALTVGSRKYEFKIPYGVIERDGAYVKRVVEKPSHSFFVNAGIYLLEPFAHDYIPRDQRFDMTDLISALLAAGHRVACFPILEYWLDIGQHVDYEKAQQDIKSGRFAA